MNQAVATFAETLDPAWAEARVRDELEALSLEAGKSWNELLDAVAIELGRRFEQREIGHSEAMAKASALYSAVYPDREIPPVLHEVYWALDEAEYGREDDDPNEEHAAETRSREQVKEVLARTSRNDA